MQWKAHCAAVGMPRPCAVVVPAGRREVELKLRAVDKTGAEHGRAPICWHSVRVYACMDAFVLGGRGKRCVCVCVLVFRSYGEQHQMMT